ncbi:Methionyl-tRNA formyltransferase [Elusimicrobium minutum Pei191]|uniref:Methionyl-tRNA formyltransferase n=1 Tax=Elusimicrobium minutum (strain Pei191) TaxID=445932 RepID=FMT_ELUMP|nr:methionyl-tRNA formyltransferase [Elusimicrobium minutum]B2KCQ4.1 RecName: Full=Methionyl-tRNA formyltransferase [Elusimicrobium minutum Pei191]ACC98300.1 Methionyl-tRNA formyltransferase [Elusimicrobium minutum Pei191]
MKTIFFGTPEVAVPYLEILNRYTEVVLVVTQPDRPRGRGMVITPCPVKETALKMGLKVLSPEKITDIEADLKAAGADYGIAVAYGQILKQHIIDIPKLGIVNIHFSLLPKFRGAAPVQHTLFAGETKTGVTAFWIDKGMDTGPVFAYKETDILPSEDAKTLFTKLISLGGILLEDVIEYIRLGQIVKIPQTKNIFTPQEDGSMFKEELPLPTYAPMIKKEDTILDFNNFGAETFFNRVRGLACGPHAKVITKINGKEDLLQIIKASLLEKNKQCPPNMPRGSVVSIENDGRILVKCYDSCIYIDIVRPAGKKDMTAASFANGHKIKPGDVIFY